MTAHTDIEREVGALLERAGWYRALARTFADPRTQRLDGVADGLDRLRPGAERACWTELWRPAARAWRSIEPRSLAAEHSRLFQGQAPCPPRETAYGDGRRIGGRQAELADIRGFYEAFGVGPSTSAPDLPDHVSTELEFFALLLLKTAYAAAEGLEEQRQVTERAAQAFLEDHLGRWLTPFRRCLEEHGAAPPYPESARLVEALVEEECKRLDVFPMPAEGVAPHDPTAASETFSCPMADTCAPLGAAGPASGSRREPT
jgi:TorA maturation chaperone TorD